MPNNTLRVLSGDIGGTKTRLAVFDVAGAHLAGVVERSYASRDYAALNDIIEDFSPAGTRVRMPPPSASPGRCATTWWT
jgi:glucokinase